MFSWLFPDKKDYKKTDNPDDKQYESNDIKIEVGTKGGYDSFSDSESDSESDIFNTEKVNKYHKKSNCCHSDIIASTNGCFDTNQNTIFSDYLAGKDIPIWLLNLVNKLPSNSTLKESKESNESITENLFGFNHYVNDFIILDNSSFIINKDMYNTIKCNLCILGIHKMKSSFIKKGDKYNYIKSLNNIKILCSCRNIDNRISGIDTKNQKEFLLITTDNHEYHKKNQTINFIVPFELISLILAKSTIKINTKSQWIHTLLSTDAYKNLINKHKSSSYFILICKNPDKMIIFIPSFSTWKKD
jgi:hypothetical protein